MVQWTDWHFASWIVEGACPHDNRGKLKRWRDKVVKGYGPATYGDRIAGFYDDHYAQLTSDHPMIETLAKLAGGGRALELGLGTGRVALPLTSRGVAVDGIDASAAMTDRLRAKPGGAAIQVTAGDFADFAVTGRYSLIYVVFNTFFALLSQDDQVRCFANCAAHLEEGGGFLVEAFYPDLTRYVRGQNISATDVGTDHVSLDVTRHDPVQQHVSAQHIHITADGLKMYPVHLRYAWPGEMDLMARLAGMNLESRWGGWRGEPYTASAGMHISVYRKQV
jgi:SAM-dependent methyltransferase